MAFADIINWKQAKTGYGIEFNLYDGSNTITCKVCAEPFFGPDYQAALLSCSELSQEMRVGDPRSKISDFTWVVANRHMQHAEGTQTHDILSDLFYHDFRWRGQTVTVKLLALDVDGTIQTDTKWVGYIIDVFWDDGKVTFEAVAKPNWILQQVIPGTTITRVAYPDAPESSIGLPIPMVFGDFWYTYDDGQNYAWNRTAELCGMGGVADDAEFLIPCICTETNEEDETAGPIFYASDHQLADAPANTGTGILFEYAHGVYVNLPNENQMGIVHVASAQSRTVTNGASGCYIAFDNDWSFTMWFYPYIEDGNSDATDWENAVDRDSTTYATIDASHTKLYLDIARPPDYGKIVGAKVYALVSYDVDAGAGEQAKFGLYDEDGTDYWPAAGDYTTFTGTGTKEWKEVSLTIGNSLNYANDFPNEMHLRMRLLNPDDGHIYVYALCLVLRYMPRWMETWGTHQQPYNPGPGEPRYWYQRYRPYGEKIIDRLPTVIEPNRIYISCKGMNDDGSGTYTGTPDSLMIAPADIVHYLLATAGCNINTSLTPADITDARTDTPAAAAFRVGQFTTYADLITDLCRQSLLGLCCRFSANMEMGCIYWGSAHAVNDYTATIPWSDVLNDQEIEIGRTAPGDVRNAFYFGLNYSYKDGKLSRLLMFDKDGSDEGSGADVLVGATYTTFQGFLSQSETDYYRREMHDEFPYMRRIIYPAAGPDSQFLAILVRYADMLYEPRRRLRLSLPWKYHDLQVGHMIQPDMTTWDAAGLPCPAGAMDNSANWDNIYFWVERVTISPDGYIENEAGEGRWYFG